MKTAVAVKRAIFQKMIYQRKETKLMSYFYIIETLFITLKEKPLLIWVYWVSLSNKLTVFQKLFSKKKKRYIKLAEILLAINLSIQILNQTIRGMVLSEYQINTMKGVHFLMEIIFIEMETLQVRHYNFLKSIY